MSKHEPKVSVLTGRPYEFEKVVTVHYHEVLDFEAQIAQHLVQHWGLVAGVPDGEDSAGRDKIRLATPEELVARACDTAALFMAEVRARGWTVPAPPPEKTEDD